MIKNFLKKSSAPKLIAEISANHNGSIINAKKLILTAKKNGADAVKLQTYTASTMVIKSRKKIYKITKGLWKGKFLWDIYKKGETPFDWHKELFDYAKKINILCFSTPFDETAVDLLEEGDYQVFIDSKLFNGSLTYGEIFIKGSSDREIFLSTYVCHPSMANNELSGIVVSSYIANWLSNKKDNRYSYRFVFIPETIGSITYLSKNIKKLKSKTFAGFNITCVGDNRDYSYLPSRNGNTISDLVAKHILKYIYPEYKSYSWNDRGSDERQYCSPGVDLPIVSIMRTKYGRYEEYHTSMDDLVNVVTPDGLLGGYNITKLAIESLENNKYPKINVLCEPQLGKRDMYPNVSTKISSTEVNLMMNVISYSDGYKSLIEIADLCKVPIWELYPIIEKLIHKKLITMLDEKENF